MTQSPPTGELVARLRAASALFDDIRAIHANAEDGDCEPHWSLQGEAEEARALASEAAEAITTLERELEEARALSERLKLEAQGHAMEARTANSTIYEIYQVLSGGRGEPGNWNGAEPARRYVTASQAEVERLKAALTTQAEEFAQIAERDTDWTLFSRQSKVEPLTGAETNVFAGPPDDGTYPTAKNVFAYTTGLAAGRAIAAAIRQRAALQVEESKGHTGADQAQ